MSFNFNWLKNDISTGSCYVIKREKLNLWMKIKCIKEHSMKQEAKKTAIITGSGRGIGKETAIILAKKSVNVEQVYQS
jgi:hypothetical protein